MLVYQRVSPLSEMTRSRLSFAVWWSGAKRARPMWSVYPIENAGHNPKREESGGHMIAVLVVLVTKNMQKYRSGAAYICWMIQKSLATQGIPGMKLIEPVENNSDETGPNCKGVWSISIAMCRDYVGFGFHVVYWNMLKH